MGLWSDPLNSEYSLARAMILCSMLICSSTIDILVLFMAVSICHCLNHSTHILHSSLLSTTSAVPILLSIAHLLATILSIGFRRCPAWSWQPVLRLLNQLVFSVILIFQMWICLSSSLRHRLRMSIIILKRWVHFVWVSYTWRVSLMVQTQRLWFVDSFDSSSNPCLTITLLRHSKRIHSLIYQCSNPTIFHMQHRLVPQ